jgi:hypothetical protein
LQRADRYSTSRPRKEASTRRPKLPAATSVKFIPALLSEDGLEVITEGEEKRKPQLTSRQSVRRQHEHYEIAGYTPPRNLA